MFSSAAGKSFPAMDSTPVLCFCLTLTLLCPAWVDSNALSDGGTPQPSVDITTPSPSPEEIDPESNPPPSVTPTDLSNCLPTDPENVTLERLLQQMMIDAIKQEILITLGLRQVPSAARLNATVQERRQILRLYQKSLAEIPAMRPSTAQTDDEKFRANQFHSFMEQGDTMIHLFSNSMLFVDSLDFQCGGRDVSIVLLILHCPNYGYSSAEYNRVRLTVCLPDYLDLTRCLSILFSIKL